MGLGDIIKKRRLELGMTQNELANDICTQALISRIEHNDIVPNKEILDRIEERLDFNSSELNIVISLNTNQRKINELIEDMRDFLVRREYKSIELLLTYNENLIKTAKEQTDIAFFKWMKAVVEHHLYQNHEDALKILSDIQTDNVTNEMIVEIINSIGLIHYENHDLETALTYFEKSMNRMNHSVHYKIQAKLYFNYALTLELSDQLRDALSILLTGLDLLLENDSLHLLGDYYYTIGFVFDRLNNYAEAKDNFELAQSIFKIQNNTRFYNLSQLALSDIKNKQKIKGD